MRAVRSAHALCAGCAVAFVFATPVAHAQLEIRHSNAARYESEFTRAYAECVAPNDMASNGILACSPAVTSPCDFSRGEVELNAFRNSASTELRVELNNVEGPGSCTTGPYEARLSLRVSVDDPMCLSSQCTWIDVDVPVPLSNHFGDFETDIDLESYLETTLGVIVGHVANYEIRGVTIVGPGGLPVAAAGVDFEHGANTLRSEATTRYAECTSPNTATQSGIPACSAPTWNASCDFAFGEIQVRENNFEPPRVLGVFSGVVGASPLCSNGTYQIGTVVRATGSVCGGSPCTLVDSLMFVPVAAVEGIIDDGASLDTVGFTGFFDSVEVRETFLVDPLAEEIASVGVTNAFALDKPRIRIGFRDLALATDDKLTVRAVFPHPPLDPTIGGARFTITDQNGEIYSVTILGDAWEVLKPGAKWQYKDKTGALAGVRKASIRETPNPSGFTVKLMAKDLNLSAADLPSVNFVMTVTGLSGTSIGMRNAPCTVKPKGRNCRLSE